VRIAQARNGRNAQVLRETFCLLDRLLQDAESKARVHSAIEILMLQALALQAQDNHIEALIALAQAVTLAEPEGYVRLFLDEGEPLLQLLSQLASTDHRASSYIQKLLAACEFHEQEQTAPRSTSKEPRSRPYQSLLDPLSERELEVLHLIAGGDSNYEIAGQLIVAVSTVKRHVSNIFSKLDVTNRTQAVARAREFGML
jgi:LuxR family maltose regulon positive regulatory protein